MKTSKKNYIVIFIDIIFTLIVSFSFLAMIMVNEKTSGNFLLIDMIVLIVISLISRQFGTFKRIQNYFDKIEKKLQK